MKDRLLLYEKVLVGLHKLSREIRAANQGVSGEAGPSAHSSRNWSSPHLEDTESVNYSKFEELLSFFKEQDSYKQQLSQQCKSLDTELAALQKSLEATQTAKEQLAQQLQSQTRAVVDSTREESEGLRKQNEKLLQQIASITKEKDELNKTNETLHKEAEEQFQTEVRLKQKVSELEEALREAKDDLEQAKVFARMGGAKPVPKDLAVNVPTDFGEDSPRKETHPAPGLAVKKNTANQVVWEDVRAHLTSQVNIYLDLQNKIQNSTFEVRCYDSEQQQPMEVNLLLEVEKLLDGIETGMGKG